MQGAFLFVPYRKSCLTIEAESDERDVVVNGNVELKPEREPETPLQDSRPSTTKVRQTLIYR